MGVLGGQPHFLGTAWCPGERWAQMLVSLGLNHLYELLQRNRTNRFNIGTIKRFIVKG